LPEYGDCFHLLLTEFERLNNLIYWNNIELSQRCADAVAQALVRLFGIDVKCSTAKGVGPLAPVASNDQESGRAINRRVALVKQ
jgi:outer membrane protein OmpA-like peptidoglycan-associated protein